MSLPSCCKCKRRLVAGESAWAHDVTVIDADGATVETRYTCFDCEPED